MIVKYGFEIIHKIVSFQIHSKKLLINKMVQFEINSLLKIYIKTKSKSSISSLSIQTNRS